MTLMTLLEIRTLVRPKMTMSSLMNGAKDKLKRQKKPGVIYALGCTKCPNVYIGETVGTVKQPAKDHKI